MREAATYLGVDGGGTKTALCVLRSDGVLLAQRQGPSIYYLSGGLDLVGRVLADEVTAVCAQAGIVPEHLRYAFFGIPGYGEASADLPALDALPRALLRHDRYRCDNDMVCGWAGSLGGMDGINVVSGTGSMTYGERGGRRARVGGWGEVFGDEGSAYWIAVRGLAVFAGMSDGRVPVGPLHGLLRSHLGLSHDLDVIDVVLNRWKADRSRIGALSRVVDAAAEEGDERAEAILADAAGELVALVEATRRRLGFLEHETAHVSYSGGVFGSPRVVDAFARELSARRLTYPLQQPQFAPAVGAALFAAKLAGAPLSEDALDRLRSAGHE